MSQDFMIGEPSRTLLTGNIWTMLLIRKRRLIGGKLGEWDSMQIISQSDKSIQYVGKM